MSTAQAFKDPSSGLQAEAALEELGERLIYVRAVVLKLGRAEMARLTDFDDSTMGTWEAGTRPRDALKVARRYHKVAKEAGKDVPVSWILDGTAMLLHSPLYGDNNRRTTERQKSVKRHPANGSGLAKEAA